MKHVSSDELRPAWRLSGPASEAGPRCGCRGGFGINPYAAPALEGPRGMAACLSCGELFAPSTRDVAALRAAIAQDLM